MPMLKSSKLNHTGEGCMPVIEIKAPTIPPPDDDTRRSVVEK
jgi:hypothetical protein